METKNGYRYKDKKGKIYVINFGLGFFEGNYTDEESAAIITHELGHAMQQAMCSINQNLAMVYIKYLFDEIYNLLNPIVLTLGWGVPLIMALMSSSNFENAKKDNPDELGDRLIVNAIGSATSDYDRDRWGEDSNKVTADTIESVSKKKKGSVFWTFVGKFLLSIITGIFKIIYDLVYPVFKMISIPQNIFMMSNMKFLKANRKFEQFADMFCSVYGLGAAQASCLKKLGSDFYKQDYGAWNWVNYVPVVNIALGFGHYLSDANAQLLAGYPSAKKRIVAIYKTLQIEIDENKDLTSEQKAELKAQIEELHKVYEEYVFDYSPKGFVYALFHKVMNKKLENESTDVKENVLDALKDLSKEQKFANINKGKNNKEVTTLEEMEENLDSKKIMAAFASTVKNLSNLNLFSNSFFNGLRKKMLQFM